jgi:hypothetical protein
VLALKIVDTVSPKRILMLTTLDAFSDGGVKRLLGLAQHLSQGWCSRVMLGFHDYNALEHENIVQAAKGCFSDAKFAEGAEVHCYDQDFRVVRH